MKVNKISGNYQLVYNTLRTSGLNLFGPLNNGELPKAAAQKSYDQIVKDLHRSPFYGNREQTKRFIDLWLNQHEGDFTQGDLSGVSIARTLLLEVMRNHHFTDTDGDQAELQAGMNEGLFSFINDKNEAAGVVCIANKHNPTFWAIIVISKANMGLAERRVGLYLSEQLSDKINLPPSQKVDLQADMLGELKSTSLAQNIVDAIHLEQQKLSWENGIGVSQKYIKEKEVKKFAWQLQCKKDKLSIDNYLSKVTEHIIQLTAASKKSQAKRLKLFVDKFSKRVGDYYNSEIVPTREQHQDFKRACVDLITKTRSAINASQALEKVLVNLLLFVLTLGIFYLAAGAIKYAVKGRFLLYDPKPRPGQSLLESMQNDIGVIKAPS